MIISVASGKGGTGKTTVATNLARALYESGEMVIFLDCDVEEPNAHIFLVPQLLRTEPVISTLPSVDQDKCIECKKCVEFCAYNALALVGGKVLVFSELCHACGGCSIVCPVDAISELERRIGVVEIGFSNAMPVLDGVLDVGEAIAPPVIKSVKGKAMTLMGDIVIMDSPPGTACPMVESVTGTDYCVLVTEPTPFGFHDLKLAVDVIRELGLNHGVVINRFDIGDDSVERFCEEQCIPVLMRIPNSRSIAEAYSEGKMMIDIDETWRQEFIEMFGQIREAIQ
jgi:MinD superfamily P-loop ATPase